MGEGTDYVPLQLQHQILPRCLTLLRPDAASSALLSLMLIPHLHVLLLVSLLTQDCVKPMLAVQLCMLAGEAHSLY